MTSTDVVSDDRYRSGARRAVAFNALVMIAIGLAAMSSAPGAALTPEDQADGKPVYQMTITGTIDLGLVPYLDRVLDEAAADDAAAVIILIDTPGGRLDAVIELRDSLIGADIPTISLVDTLALSAGALIAIATDEIYMTPGSVIGAATPVLGGTGEVADAKTISAVKAMFESTAERTGRDPKIAGAMVDTNVEIPGLSEAGELLTLSVNQALEYGYGEGMVDGLDELLAELGLADNPLVVRDPGITERLVRIITSPAITGLLLLGGVILIFGDLLSAGTGIGVVLGAILLGLFFWGHLLAGLAGWEDLALIVLGVILIGVEIFVLPGFGIAGILGTISVGVGAFLAMINRDFSLVRVEDLIRAGITLLLVVISSLLAIITILWVASRGGATRRLILQSQLGRGAGLIGAENGDDDTVTTPTRERGYRATGRWLRFFGGDQNLPHHHEDAHHRQPDKRADGGDRVSEDQ